ncbi:MAG: hypothetical protein DWQ01_08625 [Planctomycetota bacterium]|nr:MAG: hypothetical protein DWQ01_08625 [Planctomycetota bacterium]
MPNYTKQKPYRLKWIGKTWVHKWGLPDPDENGIVAVDCEAKAMQMLRDYSTEFEDFEVLERERTRNRDEDPED